MGGRRDRGRREWKDGEMRRSHSRGKERRGMANVHGFCHFVGFLMS